MKKILFLGLIFWETHFVLSLSAQQLQHPVALSANSNTMVARTPDSRPWTDPALNHNKLLQQQTSDGKYKLIGPYKVVGSQYLFGEYHKADMFTPEAKAFNIFISYNHYNQELEFYSTSNPDKPLVREPGTVDSFIIHSNTELGIKNSLRFTYGSILGSREKQYFQEIFKGINYSIYKTYKSDLTYVESNLAQSELRQFDIQVDYYYSGPDVKSIKKIKPNVSSVLKEFKPVKDLSAIINADMFSINPDEAFSKVFAELNK